MRARTRSLVLMGYLLMTTAACAPRTTQFGRTSHVTRDHASIAVAVYPEVVFEGASTQVTWRIDPVPAPEPREWCIAFEERDTHDVPRRFCETVAPNRRIWQQLVAVPAGAYDVVLTVRRVPAGRSVSIRAGFCVMGPDVTCGPQIAAPEGEQR